jgi:hypothetical protein
MLRSTPLLFTLGLGISTAACAGSASPARAPEPAGTAQAGPPAAAAGGSELPADPSQVPPPPASCKGFTEHTVAGASACGDRKAARGVLAAALAVGDASTRDQSLAALEACKQIPPGVVRALRAELAPAECGDALVEPYLEHPPGGLRPELRDALMGLGFAARAARLVREPPKLSPPLDKERVQAFVTGPLKEWIEGQAKAIQSVSLHGSSLEGYGKGVVAVEAGLADLRFVEVARSAPVPNEIAKDPELKEAYLASLEQALEPRKTRGRDAALVGLKKLSEVGVINDPRVDRARKLLSELYAGRRIDALDSLLLPALPAPAPSGEDEKLAAVLPTFYAEVVLDDVDATKPAMLRALALRGLPKSARAKLDAIKSLAPEARQLFARALVALGEHYWRSGDFAAADKVAAGAKLTGAAGDEAALVSGIARALAGGPADAAEMMLKGPRLPKGVGDVAALDALGKGRRPVAGMALFDAARLLEIARPENAAPEYWKGVADRYQRAEKLLPDPAAKKDAAARAQSARDTARAVPSPAAP